MKKIINNLRHYDIREVMGYGLIAAMLTVLFFMFKYGTYSFFK